MKSLSEIVLKRTLVAFAIILGLVLIILGINFFNANYNYHMYITAQFSELGPIYSSMPVYYKGYKIGKTKDIEPSQDYKHTLVKIILYPKRLELPDNIVAEVQKMKNNKNYLELKYPQTPSEKMLKNGDSIDGKTAVDIESFMTAQAESGQLSSLSTNLLDSTSTLISTLEIMGDFFDQLTIMVKENRPNIKMTTTHTANAAKNLDEITTNLNHAMNEDQLKGTFSNINKSSSNINLSTEEVHKSATNITTATENLKNITGNIDKATKNLDKTMNKIDTVADDGKCITSNVKGITQGFCETLSKRFGGFRMMFGKPMHNKKCNCKGCSNN